MIKVMIGLAVTLTLLWSSGAFGSDSHVCTKQYLRDGVWYCWCGGRVS